MARTPLTNGNVKPAQNVVADEEIIEALPQSRAIGLREVVLTPDEATAMAHILDDPTRPTHDGVPIMQGEPGLLRQRVR